MLLESLPPQLAETEEAKELAKLLPDLTEVSTPTKDEVSKVQRCFSTYLDDLPGADESLVAVPAAAFARVLRIAAVREAVIAGYSTDVPVKDESIRKQDEKRAQAWEKHIGGLAKAIRELWRNPIEGDCWFLTDETLTRIREACHEYEEIFPHRPGVYHDFNQFDGFYWVGHEAQVNLYAALEQVFWSGEETSLEQARGFIAPTDFVRRIHVCAEKMMLRLREHLKVLAVRYRPRVRAWYRGQLDEETRKTLWVAVGLPLGSEMDRFRAELDKLHGELDTPSLFAAAVKPLKEQE